jgi:hypothetical protein
MGDQNARRSVAGSPEMVLSFVLNCPNRAAPMFAACLALIMGIVLSSTGNRAHADQSDTSSGTTETGHKKWSRLTLDTADRIDRFFSNENIVDEGQETRLRVYVKMRTDENDGQRFTAGIRGKLSLPRTEQRLQIIFGQDDDSTTSVNTVDPNISLRIRPPSTDPMRQMRFDVGFRKRVGGYQLFGRARHRLTFDSASRWIPSITNSLHYFTKAKTEYRGQFTFDWPLSTRFFFRPTTQIRWYQNNIDKCNDGICIDQYFTLYERLRQQTTHAIAYDAEFFYRNKPGGLNDVVLKARYRRTTSRDWLFWEIEPAVHFPAADGHDMTYRITFKLEGVFGYNDTANVNDGWFIRPSALGRKSN